MCADYCTGALGGCLGIVLDLPRSFSSTKVCIRISEKIARPNYQKFCKVREYQAENR